ncbi:hypothetical protein LCL99_12225 [Halomonas denitrificans]|uniref:hypothetical protein n=1 Tax=Halomonas denitrificans TaxID=370769 RepID=UPI001CD6ADED|nr:hypothetical protein [Halomonas denitrificans]MCA0975241.1 hypothetical protein [Halomonas denitrificans]
MSDNATETPNDSTNTAISLSSTAEKAHRSAEHWKRIYLKRRKRLQESDNERKRLEKLLDSLETQESEADTTWRRSFLDSFGKQTRDVRDQLKQRNQWKLETEQTRELIALLSPQIEWLAVHTALARVAWLNNQKYLRDTVARDALEDGAAYLAESEYGNKLSQAVITLKDSVATDTYNDQGYMIKFGADVSLQPGQGIRGHLNAGMEAEIQREIEQRFHSLLGERLLHHLAHRARSLPPMTEETIAPLACEREARDLLSPITQRKVIAEIESRLTHVPNLDTIDNG